MFSGENNDAALLIRVAGGDHMALVTLYDRYASTLLALTQHILGPSAESEELLHELFLEVWCKASNYQPQHGTVRSWLILRCRERALETLRHAPDLAAQGEHVGLLPVDWDATLHPVEAQTEDPLFGQERAAVQRAIGTLPVDQQRILSWFYFENTGLKDAEAAFSMRTEHLQAHLISAHQQLRENMHPTRR